MWPSTILPRSGSWRNAGSWFMAKPRRLQTNAAKKSKNLSSSSGSESFPSESPENRNRVDLLLVEVLPDDPPRSLRPSARDDLVGCDDPSHTEVVIGLGELLVQDLKPMDRGHDARVLADQPRFQEKSELEIREAAALAHPDALAVHGHASADHEVDTAHLVDRDLPAGRRCSSDGGRTTRRYSQPLRVYEDERRCFREPGNRHVDELPFGERPGTNRKLG